MRKKTAGIAGIFIMAFLSAAFAASGSTASPPTRIYVVAVHDSSLFTLCPPELHTAMESGDFRGLMSLPNDIGNVFFRFMQYQIEIRADGRLIISKGGWVNPSVVVERLPLTLPPPFVPEASGILERCRPDWRELSSLMTGVCPSGWVDSGMREEIEAEFKGRQDYEVVDSAEEADYVFLVEGLYYTYWDPAGRRSNYFVTDTGPVFGRQLRQAAIAVLVPSETFQRDPANSAAILQARLWAGVSVCKAASAYQSIVRGVNPYLSARSASIKELVSRFVKRSKWDSAVPLVCPARSIRPGGVPDAVSGKRSVHMGGDSKRPPPIAEETRRVPSDNVIRTETVLVTVPVIASNENSGYVPGLTIKDFHLYENGIEQKIDRLIDKSVPFHAALLIDTSRSTAPVRAHIESTALAFLESLRPEDDLMVFSLSNWIHVDSEFSLDRIRLRSAIMQSAARARAPFSGARTTNKQRWEQGKFNGTRLYDALDLTVTERLNGIAGRKAILLLTDGIDTGSRLATAASTLARIEESDVLVYAIKYDTPMPKTKFPEAKAGAAAAYAQAEQYLLALANNSGGRFFNGATRADIQLALSYIAEELRHQYTLCYYPSGSLKDQSFRRIQVTVERPGVKVRSRPGYRVIR